MTLVGTPCLLDPDRIKALRARDSDDVNGLEFVEVESASEHPLLLLYFVRPLSETLAKRLSPRSIRVEASDTGDPRKVLEVQVDGKKPSQVLVTLDRPGDRHTFTLRLVEPGTDAPLGGIDPQLSAIDFSFVTNGPVDVDVLPLPSVAPPPPSETPAHYLARDYGTFLHLMYDRLALTLPDWNERHAPDLMVTLLEMFAYVADYLSYYQDAVATEAYLATARHRVSVRRHARLVDYRMHEGCSARAWVCLRAADDIALNRKVTFVTTYGTDTPVLTREVLDRNAPPHAFFEPIGTGPIILRKDRNQLKFYAGSSPDTLPAGATSAVLFGSDGEPSLAPGDVVVLEWGQTSSHPVRLIRVTKMPDDPSTPPKAPGAEPQWLVRVEWSPSDALPTAVPFAGATVCGNVVLVDEGKSQAEEDVVVLPAGSIAAPPYAGGSASCVLKAKSVAFAAPFPDPAAAGRFQARLLRGLKPPAHAPDPAGHADDRSGAEFHRRHTQFRRSVTARARRGKFLSASILHLLRDIYGDAANAAVHAAIERPLGSASSAMHFAPSDALATIRLHEKETGDVWEPRPDLLDSGPEDRHFVVEVDDDGVVSLRFGDGDFGRVPRAGQEFKATYRLGDGPVRVGARQITSLVPDPDEFAVAAAGVGKVWNPSATFGGSSRESVADVKRLAPSAFRKRRERAVIPADYAELARGITGVADASASVDYLAGVDHVRVAVVPGPMYATPEMRAELIEEVTDRLSQFRRVGHELSVVPARRVPLEVGLKLQVGPGRRRAEVERDVIERLGSGRRAGGRVGFFHADRLSLGRAIAASDLLATVQAVPGVQSVTLLRFRRLSEAPGPSVPPMLTFRPDEAPQLDNDPRHPARGHIIITEAERPGGAG